MKKPHPLIPVGALLVAGLVGGSIIFFSFTGNYVGTAVALLILGLIAVVGAYFVPLSDD